MNRIITLKMMMFAIVILSSSVQAGTTYCTTDNWEKARSYYKKYEAVFNDNIDTYNMIVDERNEFTFFHAKYSIHQISQLWAAKEESIASQLNHQFQIASERSIQLSELRKEFLNVKRRFIMSKKLWDKIGDSCENDGEWQSGEHASNNWEIADNSLDSTLDCIQSIDRMHDLYQKEQRIIEDGYQHYKTYGEH